MMRVHEDRWLNKDIDTYSDVDTYAQTMAILVDRVEPTHRMDEHHMRRTLGIVAESLFRDFMRNVRRRKPEPTAPLEERLRYALTVAHLRRELNKARRNIYASFRDMRAKDRKGKEAS